MMLIRILITYCIIISSNALSQKNNIWLTYGQSKFLYSPGMEFNYLLNKKTGVQIGVSTYILDYQPENIVNISDDKKFNFYNANIGISQNLINKKLHQIGVYTGFKMYYGPDFKILHYYNNPIYFDRSELRLEYGSDFGIYYSYKRITTLLKFDTAREKWRFGFGFKI